jgi:signal peptidase
MSYPALLAVSNDSASRFSARKILKTAAAVVMVPAVAFVAFAVLGPMVLPYRTMVVRSGSMRPTIQVGSLAVYRPVSSADLRPGDIIAFTHPGRPGEIVTHRIVEVHQDGGARSFVTKGDANGGPDAWVVPATGTGWRYRFSVPDAGYVLVALGSGTSRVVGLGILVIAVAASLLVAIWRPSSREESEDQGGEPAPRAIALGGSDVPLDPARDGWDFAGAARYTVADSATVILGRADLLLSSLEEADPRRTDVEAIRHAAERVANVLRATAGQTGVPPVVAVGVQLADADGRAEAVAVSARSGSPRLGPSAATGSAPRRPRTSGGDAARAR